MPLRASLLILALAATAQAADQKIAYTKAAKIGSKTISFTAWI